MLLNKILTYSCLSIGSVFVSGCDNDEDKGLEGVWYRQGYEEYIVIDLQQTHLKAELYTRTTGTNAEPLDWCYKEAEFPLDDFVSSVEINTQLRLKVNADILMEKDDGPYFYHKIHDLPLTCHNGGMPLASDPDFDGDILSDFEFLWHVFNSFYAYFELHEIDWNEAYPLMRDNLDENSNPEDLVNIAAFFLDETNDGHLGIDLNDDIGFEPSPRFKGVLAILLEQFDLQTEFSDYFDYLIHQAVDVMPQLVLDDYLELEGEFLGVNSDDFPAFYRWGTLAKTGNSNIGYLSISTFESDDVMLLEEKQALSQAFEALDHTDSLIIDVRNNIGGSYNLALYTAGFLIDQPTHMFDKQAYFNAGSLTPLSPVIVPPSSDNNYRKPVVILQNALSISAAETFTLAMMSLDNVTIIGEASQGMTASSITRTLPFSGITLHIPSDIHRSLAGESFEKVGVPVDIKVPDNRFSGVDEALLNAIEHFNRL